MTGAKRCISTAYTLLTTVAVEAQAQTNPTPTACADTQNVNVGRDLHHE